MFSLEMLFLGMFRRIRRVLVNQLRDEIHLRNFLKHFRMINRLETVLAPCERSVVAADHARYIDRITALKGFDNHLARVLLISLLDFFRRQVPGAGDRSIEIIRMRCALQGDIVSGLGPANRKCRMRVHDTADLRECLVQFQVRRGIRGGIQVSLDLVPLKIHDDHMLRLELLIGNSARLNHKQSLLPVNPADITPGKCDQFVLRKLQIRPADILLQFLKHVPALLNVRN